MQVDQIGTGSQLKELPMLGQFGQQSKIVELVYNPKYKTNIHKTGNIKINY